MFKKILLLVIPVLLLVIALESGVRIYFFLKKGFIAGPIASYLNDDVLGYRPNPGSNLSYFSFDKYGFRGPEFRKDHPFVILCIGGSTTFGTGNSDQETYPAQLEAELVKRGYDVEVVNAGVSGYNTHHFDLIMDRLLDLTKPKIVFIHSTELVIHPLQRYYIHDHWPTYFLFKHSFLFRWLDSKLRMFGASIHYRSWPSIQGQMAYMDSIAAAQEVFDSYYSDLLSLVEKSRGAGACPILLFSPALFEADSLDDLVQEFKGTIHEGKDKTFFEYGEKFNVIREKSVARLYAVRDNTETLFIDLNPLFTAYEPAERSLLFYDQIHPIKAGNSLIASCLADTLETMGLLQPALKSNK